MAGWSLPLVKGRRSTAESTMNGSASPSSAPTTTRRPPSERAPTPRDRPPGARQPEGREQREHARPGTGARDGRQHQGERSEQAGDHEPDDECDPQPRDRREARSSARADSGVVIRTRSPPSSAIAATTARGIGVGLELDQHRARPERHAASCSEADASAITHRAVATRPRRVCPRRRSRAPLRARARARPARRPRDPPTRSPGSRHRPVRRDPGRRRGVRRAPRHRRSRA